MISDKDTIRLAAERDLEFFIRLVQPNSVLGGVHCELIKWLTREEAKPHQLVLLPRGHRKSYLMAMLAAWEITRNPAITILYISSTSNLANKQLGLVKEVLTSDIYRYYWPEMVHPDEAKRTKWSESEISVDHPLRKAESIRDPTIFTAGLTTNIVGLHCDLVIPDDVVTDENSSTEEGRENVSRKLSLLTSIKNPNAREKVCGTRYDPEDAYGNMLAMTTRRYDEEGKLIAEEPLYEDFTRVLENIGDGSGEYLWPKQQRKDGRWFGFDREVYENVRAQYSSNERIFRAQYYNDPTYAGGYAIPREFFQYYDKAFLGKGSQGNWFFKNERLNVFAAIDFAFTLSESSDYTSIVVVGVDRLLNYYVLDIDRFKTNSISEYFQHLFKLQQKWGFHKIRAEATAAQSVIIHDLKTNYIRPNGIALAIDEYKPTVKEKAKENRIHSILQPRYANRQMWHYIGGNCQVLEDELIVANPSHDDVKDALASCIDVAIAPTTTPVKLNNNILTHPRFGGIA